MEREPVIQLEDGFFYYDTFWGAMDAEYLRSIANRLDRMNSGHAVEIERFFRQKDSFKWRVGLDKLSRRSS